jgi:hypothetical protein
MATTSNTTIRTISPKSASKAIKRAISKRRPIMLWGPPGIGKSDVVAQIGKEQGREVIDIRLALWDPTDIKGMPYLNEKDGTMNWAPPSELPHDPNSNAIVFLDEIVSAPPAVQAAAYQLILNRRVGKYRLPEGVDIVAAGNREGDRGVTYKMPAPLASRFIHLEMAPSNDDWVDWAVNNNVHPDVIGYISFAKQDLFNFDPQSPSRSFACPRTWNFVSDLLWDEDGDTNSLTDLVSGAIGDGLALKFIAHRKLCGKLPKAIDILEGTVTELKNKESKEVSAMYSLTVSLCYELKELSNKKVKKWHEYTDRYFRFMMDNFPTELVIMGAKVALTNYELDIDPKKLTSFDDFFNKFGKYVFDNND